MITVPDIKERARLLGFDGCGIARCRPLTEEAPRLRSWLDKGNHAGMEYMANHFDMRIDPSLLIEGTRTVIVCFINYKSDFTYPADIPQIAAYARSTDYHYTLKQRLNSLLEYIGTVVPGTQGRAFVDSAPILERSWAVEAGLGWIGHNSLLINKRFGSFILIGTILTNLELPPDAYDKPYTENHCGGCRQCIDHCPTGAIQPGGTIDAGRCISYQTIENRKSIPPGLAALTGNRLFGCDTCQQVCPHNVRTDISRHDIFTPIEGITALTATEWQQMGSGEFKRRFGHTPLMRCGLKKFKQTLEQQKEGFSGSSYAIGVEP